MLGLIFFCAERKPARAGVRQDGPMPRKLVDKYKDITMPSGRVIRSYSQVSDETWARKFAPKSGPVALSINSTRRSPSAPAAPVADGQDQPQAAPVQEAKPRPSSKKR